MVEVTKLSQDRWQDNKIIRLEALGSDPIAYGNSYEEEETFAPEVWQARIRNVVFAVANNKPVGTAGYIFNERLKTRHIATIVGVYVSKEHRNQGIGTALISKTISVILENKNIVKISLTVNPAQAYAVKLYQKHGFESIGRARKEIYYQGKYYDELLMERFV